MDRRLVLYGTRGRQLQMHDDLDPGLAAALARAHNNWTHDYCAANPKRLKFAAQLSFHDVGLAVKEARRAVRELGAVRQLQRRLEEADVPVTAVYLPHTYHMFDGTKPELRGQLHVPSSKQRPTILSAVATDSGTQI